MPKFSAGGMPVAGTTVLVGDEDGSVQPQGLLWNDTSSKGCHRA